jgi:Arm DNA-binding domain
MTGDRYPHMLTEQKIKAARADKKQRKLFDGGGLYLLITPTGSKLWRWKYRFAGREKVLAMGIYPAVSLKRAREEMGCRVSRSGVGGIEAGAQQHESKNRWAYKHACRISRRKRWQSTRRFPGMEAGESLMVLPRCSVAERSHASWFALSPSRRFNLVSERVPQVPHELSEGRGCI